MHLTVNFQKESGGNSIKSQIHLLWKDVHSFRYWSSFAVDHGDDCECNFNVIAFGRLKVGWLRAAAKDVVALGRFEDRYGMRLVSHIYLPCQHFIRYFQRISIWVSDRPNQANSITDCKGRSI